MLAKSLNFRCGVDVTRWGIFPIIGSFHGPGGIFGVVSLFLRFFPIFSAAIMKRKKEIRANKLKI